MPVKSFVELRNEINSTIYENTTGAISATNLNSDLMDVVDTMESVKYTEIPDATVGQVNPIAYERTRYPDGTVTWTVATGGGGGGTIDTAMSTTSTNAVQNCTITNWTNNKVSTEETARQTADNALDARLDVIEPRLPAGSGALALQADLNAEITNRTTAVSNEATARSTADTTLQSNIDTEATNRQTGDSNLHTEITTETTARETADVTLQNNIDAEETARINADTALSTRVTTLEGLHQSGKTVAQEVADGIAGLDVTDTPVAGEFVTSVSEVDGKVSVTRSAAITEVQVNGTALTPAAGAVNIPASSWDKIGVLKVGGSAVVPANRTKYATTIYDNTLYVANASTTQVGVVTVGDNIVVTDASQGKISVPDASDSVKGVLVDVPAATASDVEYVRKRKADGTVEWSVNSGGSGTVTDVKVNGTTVVSAGVANIPLATDATAGAVVVDASMSPTSTNPVQNNSVKAYVDGAGASIRTELTTEVTARETADIALQANIDTEEAARIAADTAEVTNRNTAITTAIQALDYADAAVAGQAVRSVSEADGIISVTRSATIDEVKVAGTALTPTAGSVDIPEASDSVKGVMNSAPSDGKYYGQQNGGWALIPTASATAQGIAQVSNVIDPALVVGIDSTGVLSVGTATDSIKGVLYDAPNVASKSYVRSRDAAGAVSWSELNTANLAHINGTPTAGQLAIFDTATDIKAADVLKDDAGHTLTGATDANFATSKAVKEYVDALAAAFAGALIWKGTVADEASITALGTPALGWEVVASANFTHSTLGAISAGDALIYNGTAWQHVKLTIDITAGSSALVADTDVTLATVKGVEVKANLPKASSSVFGAVKTEATITNNANAVPTSAALYPYLPKYTTTFPTTGLEANTLYLLGTISSTPPTIYLPTTATPIDEYCIQFDAAADFTVTISGAKTLGGLPLECATGKTYVITIRNGLAIMNEFA